MITLYHPETTDFDNNGLGALFATSAIVTEELNGMYELQLTLSSTELNRKLLPVIGQFYIVKASAPTGPQLFRIYALTKQLNGDININARHIFYDSLFNLVNGLDVSGKTTTETLEALYAATAVSNPFQVSSDITDTLDISLADTNPAKALLGDDGIIDTLKKGELQRDNFKIALLSSMGKDRGFTVRYRKNLTGLNLEINSDNMATIIKPVASDNNSNPLYLPEAVIQSPFVSSYFMPIYAVMELTNIRLGSKEVPDTAEAYRQMRAQVAEFFENGGDMPTVNAKINFILLKDTNEYKEFSALETIFLGDSVTAIHPDLNVDMAAKCIKYTWDSLLDRYESIELGAFRSDFATTASKQISKLQGAGSASTSSDVSTILEKLVNQISAHAHTGEDGTVKINKNNLI